MIHAIFRLMADQKTDLLLVEQATYKAALQQAGQDGADPFLADVAHFRREARIHSFYGRAYNIARALDEDEKALSDLKRCLDLGSLEFVAREVLTELDIEIMSAMCGQTN